MPLPKLSKQRPKVGRLGVSKGGILADGQLKSTCVEGNQKPFPSVFSPELGAAARKSCQSCLAAC